VEQSPRPPVSRTGYAILLLGQAGRHGHAVCILQAEPMQVALDQAGRRRLEVAEDRSRNHEHTTVSLVAQVGISSAQGRGAMSKHAVPNGSHVRCFFRQPGPGPSTWPRPARRSPAWRAGEQSVRRVSWLCPAAHEASGWLVCRRAGGCSLPRAPRARETKCNEAAVVVTLTLQLGPRLGILIVEADVLKLVLVMSRTNTSPACNSG